MTSLKAGEPAPEAGFLVPPAVMVELGPYMAEALRGEDAKWKPTPQTRKEAMDAIIAPNPRDAGAK